ncbi:amidase family protein [Xanthomonas hyacinthi]|nr:amidase family protein [Xanthomonas hyacinthi]
MPNQSIGPTPWLCRSVVRLAVGPGRRNGEMPCPFRKPARRQTRLNRFPESAAFRESIVEGGMQQMSASAPKTENRVHAAADRLAWEIGRLDAHDQAALVRRGELSARELCASAIARIEQLDPALNAITHRDYDAALTRAERAQGEMAGVPWLLKDGLDYRGMPNRSGSQLYRDAPPGEIEFAFTRAFDRAGLIALGKTNAPEFGLLPTTEPLLYGPARNPWAADRSPGGSSGGAAIAVATGMTPLAHAADGGGSIRIPACCCGVIGLKPGRGATARARAPHLIEDLLACDMLLARSVRDVDWAMRTASAAPVRPARRDAGLRIAVVLDSLDGRAPHPQVRESVLRSAQLCRDLGHEVFEAGRPYDGPATLTAFKTVWAYLARDIAQGATARFGPAAETLAEPWTLELAQWAGGVRIGDTDAMMQAIADARGALQRFFATTDVVLSPVLDRPALRIGELGPSAGFGHIMELMFDYVSYTPLHNLTGHPAMSLPLFPAADGVPIGSMFAAAHGGENTLIALAYQLEQAMPWRDRWPPILPHGTGAG